MSRQIEPSSRQVKFSRKTWQWSSQMKTFYTHITYQHKTTSIGFRRYSKVFLSERVIPERNASTTVLEDMWLIQIVMYWSAMVRVICTRYSITKTEVFRSANACIVNPARLSSMLIQQKVSEVEKDLLRKLSIALSLYIL